MTEVNMKLQFLSTAIISILLCASCQSQDGSDAASSMEESSRSHFGIDVESLGYIVSGPMTVLIEPDTLSIYKQEHPIDQLIASGYIAICKSPNGRLNITQTEKARKLRAMFRKSKGPASGFGETLGEPECQPLKQ
jgi:hypothetical protein